MHFSSKPAPEHSIIDEHLPTLRVWTTDAYSQQRANQIYESIMEDAPDMIKFEEVLVMNEVSRKILDEVFRYLVRSWTKIVRKIQSRNCDDCDPFLSGYNDIHVPENKKDEWRKYFGVVDELELEWFNMFDEDKTESSVDENDTSEDEDGDKYLKISTLYAFCICLWYFKKWST